MTEKKKKIGRPSKYNANIIEKVKHYLSNYESLGMVIPTQSHLCRFIGITEETSIQWKKTHELYSELLAELEAIQRDKLLNNGLSGSFNSAITKLILHKHGYSERIEQSTDITSKGEAITAITREIIK